MVVDPAQKPLTAKNAKNFRQGRKEGHLSGLTFAMFAAFLRALCG
jgi:hypothetical protein